MYTNSYFFKNQIIILFCILVKLDYFYSNKKIDLNLFK